MKKKAFTDTVATAVLILIGAMLILRQKEVSAAVVEALKSCAYRIIPSLFAMTVVSGAISKSGVLSVVTRHTRLSPDVAAALVFGNIGGYPIGAKLLSDAVDAKRLTPLQAGRALCFCYNCGPAFAVGVAGAALFGNASFGLAAFLSCVMSNLTLFAIFLIFNKDNAPAEMPQIRGFSSSLMTESVRDATSAMMTVCPMIVFFSALKAVLEASFPALADIGLLPPVLEISNISACKGVSLVAAAAFLGFGGICVHMQVIAIIGGRFSVKQFYFTRLIQLPLCALYAFIFGKIFERLGIVCEAATKIRLSQSSSLIPIICVAAMVFITVRDGKTIR